MKGFYLLLLSVTRVTGFMSSSSRPLPFRVNLAAKASAEDPHVDLASTQLATLAASFVLSSCIAINFPQVATAAALPEKSKSGLVINPAATTTSAPTAAVSPSSIISDPLATLKTDVVNAKTSVASTTAALDNAKKSVLQAKNNEIKAMDNLVNAEKNFKAAKQALIVVNDQLADAKTKESDGGPAALKQVTLLAAKVGSFYSFSWT
jgi:hypothetical protein